MKEKLLLFIKGIIIGAGKIIPGVSGGMLAITLNVYDKGIEAISNFFKDIKKNLTFLFTIGSGIMLSILLISGIIKVSLENYYLPTMLLFIGMISGGIPQIVNIAKQEKSIKNILFMLIPFILIFTLTLTSTSINEVYEVHFLPLVLIGILDAVTMLVPGISGTAVLMMLGYYNILINAISSFFSFKLLSHNISILLPFIIGLVIGIIILSKIINYLLNKYYVTCHYVILGFTVSSILMLLGQTIQNNYQINEILISLVALFIGYFISNKLEKLTN